MNLEQARRTLWEKVAAKSEPVDPERTRRYQQQLHEDYTKYMVESRTVAKKTAEMSRRTCVG
jgi:uncharacterized membrane protein